MYKSSHKTNKDINMDNSEMRRKVKQYKKSKFIYETTIWMYKTKSAYKKPQQMYFRIYIKE